MSKSETGRADHACDACGQAVRVVSGPGKGIKGVLVGIREDNGAEPTLIADIKVKATGYVWSFALADVKVSK